MPTRAVTIASQALQRCKTNFCKHVKRDLTLAKDYFIYLDKHAPTTATTVNDTSKNLQDEKSESIHIVKVQPKTITLESDDNLDTVSIDRILIAQRKVETSLPPPAARRIAEANSIRTTQEKPKTNKHNDMEGEIDPGRFGSNGNHADE